MADNFKPVQAKRFTLSGSGCTSSATSIIVTAFELPSGEPITMSMFGTKGFGVLEPGTSLVENISFTGITDNSNGTYTLTGVTRGLSFTSPYDGSSTRAFAHVGGSAFILSNSASFYDKFAIKDNDETITGLYEFDILPKSNATPTEDEDLATKAYADSLALGTTTVNRLVIAGIAGETVAAGDSIYFDYTDNEWKKTDADTLTTLSQVKLGIAQGAGTDGNPIDGGVLESGLDTNQTGMTAGDLMYLSNTAGGISATPGTISRVIGIARSSTDLMFDPDFYYSVPDSPSSFVTTSAGAGDSGKGVKLNVNGILDSTLLPVMKYELLETSVATTSVSIGANTNTTANIYTKSLPAGFFTLNTGLRITVNTTVSITVGNNSGNSSTLYVNTKLGATTALSSVVATGTDASANGFSGQSQLVIYILNNGSLSSQRIIQTRQAVSGTAVRNNEFGATSSSSINTSGALDLAIDLQASTTANSAGTITGKSIIIEKISY